jgi:hypothetical protein
VDAVETLIPELRSLYGAIRIPRVANIDRPLNTLKGVSVRTEQILEESYPVAAHRTLSHQSIQVPSCPVRLLTRITRSVAPTQAGERLLQNIGPRFEEIDAELAAVRDLREKPAGTIRITAMEYAGFAAV